MFSVQCSHGDSSCVIDYDGDTYSPDIVNDLVKRAAEGLAVVIADLMQYSDQA